MKNKGSAVVCLRTCANAGFAQKVKSADRTAGGAAEADRITREVRHELVMLPYYGVFDNLAYQGGWHTVTLMGQVTRPTLKSDAENVVKDIEGVEKVNNQIQVLAAFADGRPDPDGRVPGDLRQPGLDRYAMQAVPPIHIIVDNGKVTLEGVVANAGRQGHGERQCQRRQRRLFGDQQPAGGEPVIEVKLAADERAGSFIRVPLPPLYCLMSCFGQPISGTRLDSLHFRPPRHINRDLVEPGFSRLFGE